MKNTAHPRLKTLVAVTALCLAAEAGAVTLTVTNSADTGIGTGTLRDMLLQIAGDTSCTGAPYVVTFNIATPPTGPILIQPGSALPAIGCQTEIDGYSQPGTAPNSNFTLDGSNAVIRVVIDGTGSGGANYGLNLSGPNSVVRGLSIVNFAAGSGILATGSNSEILGNFIGVRPDGSAAGNLAGVDFNFSNGRAGSAPPGNRNVVSANLGQGIKLGFGGFAENNLVGVGPDGTSNRGNGTFGITANLEGGTITGNRIAFNQKGIVSFSNFNANWSGNEIFSNGLLGVDLCNDGLNPNDPLDGDFGTPNPCNALQNSAVITGVTFTATDTNFTATLNTNPGSSPYSVAFYGNDDALGQGRFPTACAATGIATDASGNNTTPISVTCPGTHPNPTAIVAGPNGSSEFSLPFLTPDALLNPAGANLGPVPVGGSSAVTPVTITNNGLGPMNISSIAVVPPGEFTDTNGTPANLWCGLGPTATGLVALLPTQSCTLNLIFTPQGSGARSAVLTVGTGSTVPLVGDPSVALAGLGTAVNIVPSATFSPPTITAGGQSTLALNLSNPNLQGYILSSSTVSLPGGVVVATGAAAVNSPCSGSVTASPGVAFFDISGLTVPPGANCDVTVDVTAPAPGTFPFGLSSGDLAGGFLDPSGAPVTNDATILPANLVVNPALAPLLGASTSTVAFPGVTVFTTSAPIPVTLTNTGTAPLMFSGPITTAAPFAVTNTCPVSPATLLPAASCSLAVTFTPNSTAAASGTISISSDGGAATVGLSGTGTVIPPAVNWSLTPLSVTVGGPSVLALTIANDNGAPFDNPTFTHNLPPGLVVAPSPNPVNPAGPCLGSFAGPTAGASSFTVNGLQVPTTGFCTFSVSVTSSTPGTYGVSMAAGGIVGNVASVTNVQSAASNLAQLVVTAAPAPVLSINPLPPGPLAFGNVTVGSLSAPAVVTLVNAGTSPLTFSGAPAITGPFVLDAATGSPCPSTLPPSPGPGNSCTVEAKFAPVATGPASGTLAFASDGGSATLNLTGTGDPVPAPAVSFSPPSLSFPAQMVGTVSSPQMVLLGNSGTANLAIVSVTSGGDFAHSSTCPLSPSTLAPATACDITVTFSPLLAGGRAGAVTVVSNAPGSPHQVTLSGTGTAAPMPVVSVSPDPVSFPATQVGGVSAPVQVTVTNAGGAALSVTAVEIVGAGFAVASNGCTATVPIGGQCIVTLTFAPGAAGTATATLRILSNAPASPTFVGLSGSGSALPVATLSASPSTLTFAAQEVGSSGLPQTVTLTNTGGATAAVSGVTVSGDFAQTNNCTAVNAGESCTIVVTFTPTGTGSRTGAIVVAGNASNTPFTIALSGSASPPPLPVLELSVSSLSYGNRLIGAAGTTQSVTLRNAGGRPLTLAPLERLSEFPVANGCPTVVQAGQSCRIDVGFGPFVPGPRSARLEVRSDASNGTQGVDLAGTGCRFNFLNRDYTLLCQ